MSTDTFIPQIPAVKVGVGNLAVRFVKKASQWGIIYLWGYYGLSPGWLVAPLILSVLRYVYSNLTAHCYSIFQDISGRRKRNSKFPLLKQQPEPVRKRFGKLK